MNRKKRTHPAIPELKRQMEKGSLSRREFIRYSALLGLSVTAAGQLAGMVLPRKAAAAGVKRGGVLRDRSSGPFFLDHALQCHAPGLGVHDLYRREQRDPPVSV